MDLGETVPSVCSETCLIVCADGSEVSAMRVEEVLHMQEEEDHLAIVLPAVNAADKVCYVCNIVVYAWVVHKIKCSCAGSITKWTSINFSESCYINYFVTFTVLELIIYNNKSPLHCITAVI